MPVWMTVGEQGRAFSARNAFSSKTSKVDERQIRDLNIISIRMPHVRRDAYDCVERQPQYRRALSTVSVRRLLIMKGVVD